jgi:hypothetical protein
VSLPSMQDISTILELRFPTNRMGTKGKRRRPALEGRKSGEGRKRGGRVPTTTAASENEDIRDDRIGRGGADSERLSSALCPRFPRPDCLHLDSAHCPLIVYTLMD